MNYIVIPIILSKKLRLINVYSFNKYLLHINKYVPGTALGETPK